MKINIIKWENSILECIKINKYDYKKYNHFIVQNDFQVGMIIY